MFVMSGPCGRARRAGPLRFDPVPRGPGFSHHARIAARSGISVQEGGSDAGRSPDCQVWM